MSIKRFLATGSGRAVAVMGLVAGAALTLVAVPALADPRFTPTTVVIGNEARGGAFSHAQCPDGTGLTGGGYVSDSLYTSGGAGVLADSLDGNGPSVSRQGAWAVRMHRGGIQAYALCLEGARTEVVSGNDASRGAFSHAQCPRDTYLIGGGYASTPVYSSDGLPADAVEGNGPSVSSATWGAKMRRGSIKAYALCRQDDF